MNKNDAILLSNLRANGRMPLTVLAQKTGLPVSTIHCRLQKRVKEGLFKPALLLNFEKISFSAHAFVLLSVQPTERDKMISHLNTHPNVNSLYRVNNGWHVLFDCVFRDLRALELFMDSIESKFTVKEKQVHYVLAELKTETFLAGVDSPDELC